MKYVYWVLISLLILWEANALQDIYEFSAIWQYAASIILIGYFAYLLRINISLKSIRLAKN
ncbi:hypothetical protein Pryu01_02235 [Paraliobacillus ryukyuensis]|uniref:Uncharacterized protein n=1 Tax=Paraliobacillus ryukyuensis TaxID=200904 RepID=A0A366E6S6_9BACI|nr:hypothetical protein [Paraliobacillus ryukyuensis]RBO98017.1 hypothetical protein DES48_10637 [Paraliobacillus ryukyuensis]